MKEVKDAIRVFLEGSEHRALLVSGDWGTGKTHLTREALEAWQEADADETGQTTSKWRGWASILQAPNVETSRRNKWLHISLYGKKSTAEIDSALAIAYVISRAEKIPFSDNLRHLGPFLGNSESNGVLGHLAKEFGKSDVLWLDDLERKAEALPLSDVIAYVDVFMNTYGGKVICIVNTDRLPPEERDWLLQNAEKTFPRRIKLQPTIEYVESIVASDPNESDAVAIQFIKKLEIANIRIAREILANSREYLKVVAPPDVTEQQVKSAITTVCVATAAVAGLRDFPTPAFLQGPISEILLGEEELSDEEKVWRKRLSLAGYIHTDKLDKEIIRQVERGYFSAAPLKERVIEQKQEDETPLNKAWDIYHNSLDGDTEAFVKKFAEGARASLLTTSINNMNSTIRLLRLLDRPDLADEIAKEFADARMALPPVALDHSDDHFFDTSDKDENFIAALDAKLAEKVAKMNLNEALAAGAAARHFDRYQSQRLAQATPQQLAGAFLEADSDAQSRIIKTCLEMARYPEDKDRAALVANTKAALKLIAGESKLNRVRIARKFGVKFD
jgi:hypothetical protein